MKYKFIILLLLLTSCVQNYSRLDLDKSLTFPIVKKGSSYLIKEFPNKENYDDAKEKIQEL